MSSYLDASRLTLPMLKVVGFEDEARSKKVAELSLPFLQESLDVSMEQCLKTVKAQDGKEVITGSRNKPSAMKVSFVLDDITYGTPLAGAALFLMPNSSSLPRSVEKNVKTMNKILYNSKDPNKPNYLTIQSKNMPVFHNAAGTFHCVVQSMKVKNEMVNAWGDRVKALIECEFKYAAKKNKVKSAKASKATKEVTLDSSKKFMNVAASSYGSSALSGALAKANGLDSIRGDMSGKSIKAPPKPSLGK